MPERRMLGTAEPGAATREVLPPELERKGRRALTALDAYAAQHEEKNEPLADVLSDLLADLMHLCDGEARVDFDARLDKARVDYNEEKEEHA